MPTRETIKNELQKEHDALIARYRSFTPEELNTPCTESEVPGAAPWRALDHLSHLAIIERAFQGMAKRTIAGKDDPVGFSRSGTSDREGVIAWIHRNNQAYVEAHHDDDLETRFADLATARAGTLALIDSLTDEQLAMPIPGAPWNDGTIGGVLLTNAHHAVMHTNWVEEGMKNKTT